MALLRQAIWPETHNYNAKIEQKINVNETCSITTLLVILCECGSLPFEIPDHYSNKKYTENSAAAESIRCPDTTDTCSMCDIQWTLSVALDDIEYILVIEWLFVGQIRRQVEEAMGYVSVFIQFILIFISILSFTRAVMDNSDVSISDIRYQQQLIHRRILVYIQNITIVCCGDSHLIERKKYNSVNLC